MRLQGLKARQARRSRATTKRNTQDSVAPNVLERDFDAERPDWKWLTDMTYILSIENVILKQIQEGYQIMEWDEICEDRGE